MLFHYFDDIVKAPIHNTQTLIEWYGYSPEDVYARHGKNGGYFPQCDNGWEIKLCPKQCGEQVFCDECENKNWT